MLPAFRIGRARRVLLDGRVVPVLGCERGDSVEFFGSVFYRRQVAELLLDVQSVQVPGYECGSPVTSCLVGSPLQ